MCSARWLKLSHSGVCKKRVYLHTRRQVYATNWCQRFKVAPISMCTHTHTQRYCLTLVRGIPWTCFNTRVEFRGQFSNFKETLIIFPDFKEGKKNKHSNAAKSFLLLKWPPASTSYSRFRNKWIWDSDHVHTNGEAKNTKASPTVLAKPTCLSSALSVPLPDCTHRVTWTPTRRTGINQQPKSYFTIIYSHYPGEPECY